MPKTSTRSRSAKTQLGGVVRGRDAEFPSAPIHVTGDAQAKVIDINTARQFDFSRMERNKLPERPSTSSGPAANLSMRRNAEKRETKDDLHFNPLGAHGSGTTFYNFPLPGSLPTPSNTPRSSPPIRMSSLPCADTPDSMEAKNLNVPPMEIGMALGSPTHQPTDWQSQAPIMSAARNDTPDSGDTYVDNDAHVAAPSKQKASKWKIFGGLFGGGKKNQAGSPQSFYQLQPEGVVVQTTREADYVNFGEPVSSSDQKPSKSRGRGRTNSQRKAEKHKPDMKRAQTAPLNFDFQDSWGRTTGTPQITLDGGPLDVHPGKRHAHGGPLLDVDIPSVEMERYSVMFGSLLQKPTGTSSSLLARRQATLDRLKTVNEALALKEQELEAKAKQLRPRRATSPQPTKSPAFSLFPNTPSRLTVRDGSPSPNRRSPLQRSNTSPAALSPNRPTFAPGLENETHATLMAPGPHVPMAIESDSESIAPQRRPTKSSSRHPPEAPSKPQSLTRNWSPEESHLTLDSPSSDVEEEDIYDPAPFPMKPKLAEPSWQMIGPSHVPTPSVSGSTSSSSEHSTSTSASSISTTSIAPFTSSNLKTVKIQAPPPKLRSRSATTTSTIAHPKRKGSEASLASLASSSMSNNPGKKSLDIASRHTDQEDHEARLKTAAEVSIARQISVSRQQRQLLIPIKPSSTSTSPNPSTISKYNQNFPSTLNTMNMNRVASPLGAVASAARAETAESPIDRNGRPVNERKGSKTERLVAASVKPSTPTLVVVGSGEKEKKWGGKAVDSPISTGSGEIRVGLAVEHAHGSGRSGLGPGEVHGHQYRKSERVVVERVSIASS